jgi:YD repeat-containing protein
LHESNNSYLNAYIRNRPTLVTVTGASGSATLQSNTYDAYSINALVDRPSLTLHDASFSTTKSVRGNVTTAQSPGATRITTYDIGGVAVTLDDGNGHKANVAPTDTTADFTPQSVKPNTNNPTTDSLLQTSFTYTASYAPSSVLYPNPNDSASVTYDSVGRVATSTSRYGAVTSYTYYPAQNQTVATTPVGTATRWQRTTTDGFGRTIRVESGSGTTAGSGTLSTVETLYGACACSPLGKVVAVSLPFAPSETEVWTQYTYDGSGRTLSVRQPDGSYTTYVYTGNTTKVTDPANHWKQFTMDALGNLTTVAEPDPTNNNNTLYSTYSYDVFSHVSGVSMTRGMAAQTRTFLYDATTARLNSVTTPEAGTVTYTYNSDGTLQSKKAKNQTTQYTYDAYQRLTKSDPGDPCQVVYYAYDWDYIYSDGQSPHQGLANGLGRLTHMTWGVPASCPYTFTEDYNYSPAGQLGLRRLTIYDNHAQKQVQMQSAFSYDGEGRVSTIEPGGVDSSNNLLPVYHYDRDALGRPSDLYFTTAPNFNVPTYLIQQGAAVYNGAGRLTSMTTTAGAVQSRQYNLNQQLTRITATQSGSTVMDLSYTFATGSTGNSGGPANNGRIASMVDNMSGEQVTYAYDQLNRLTQATAPSWGLSFGYDGFGNLLQQTATSGAPPQMSVQINPASNQITNNASYAYDANGNLTQSPGQTYTYDAANRFVSDGSTSYYYNPQGQRLMVLSAQGATIFA